MKLTKLESAQKMSNMWWWLHKNPSKGKEDYFDEVCSIKDWPSNMCFACEYDDNIREACQSWGALKTQCGGSCHFCPLVGFAWDFHCYNGYESPYFRWCDADADKDEVRKAESAKEMAEACDRAVEYITNNPVSEVFQLRDMRTNRCYM